MNNELINKVVSRVTVSAMWGMVIYQFLVVMNV